MMVLTTYVPLARDACCGGPVIKVTPFIAQEPHFFSHYFLLQPMVLGETTIYYFVSISQISDDHDAQHS
jgi:hypothetical protein